MTDHFCISPKTRQLGRWRQAFPKGRIADSPENLPTVGPSDLLWLHSFSAAESRIDRVIAAARKVLPQIRIVVISNTPTQQEALLALHSGAAGYCHAQAAPSLLQQVATVVSNGGLWIGTELMNRLLAATGQSSGGASEHPALACLTPREREVAQAVGRGISNKEAAHRLGISERTVKAHLSAIFEKLGVRDRLQLVVLLRQDSATDAELYGNPACGAFPG